jgi:catechol 2,3-dioxygenase-like lactoylglutathione lyase family enzyme
MAAISYIAYLVDNPDDQVNFYNRYLKTREAGRSPEGDISITDGFFNLTFFKNRPELHEVRMEPGLNHIGFEVESVEETKKRYVRYMPRGTVVPESGDLYHGQMRIHDPDCNPVSLSEKGFGVKKERRLPGIRHVVYNTLDTERMLEFYCEVFGLREVTVSKAYRQQGKPGRFAGDGFTNLAILTHYSNSPGHQPKFGLNHVGFVVQNVKAVLDEMKNVVTINERVGTAERPYAEWRFTDPFGNYVDLSEGKGWEVDAGKWEQAA